MKQLILLTIWLMCNVHSQGQVITIQDANFRQALMNGLHIDSDDNGLADAKIDANNDGKIQIEEALAVKKLNVSEKNIHSLKGIDQFSNLKSLLCDGNQLESLDLTGLMNLRDLSCKRNQIKTLDVNHLGSLEALRCDRNQLTSLAIYDLKSLKYLRCSYNQLTSLDLRGLPSLYELSCDYNQLTTLNFSGFSNLSWLLCSANLLTMISPFQLPHLKGIYCAENLLTTLDTRGLTQLRHLDCSGNQLKTLYIGPLIKIRFENTLKFDENHDLEYICCHSDQLDLIKEIIYDHSLRIESIETKCTR
jgi:Leucine-rich repeat (LRR) protein